jgi:signal transduction histidine kinase
VGLVATVRAGSRGGLTFAATGVLGVAFTLHWGTAVLLSALDRFPPGGHLAVLLAGTSFAALGAGRDLQGTFSRQSTELLHSKLSARELEARAQAARLVAEERVHEARNALAAIDGATRILERHHDRLPPEDRTALARAVASEVARLQLLVAADVRDGQRATFDVAEALAPAITGARALGLTVDVAVPAGMTAYGSWSAVAAVVQNLLENVRRHAPGSTAQVRAAGVRDRLVITVADRGPGVAAGQEEAIFERGARGSGTTAVPGSGLGLDIARRTVRRQGGELRYEARPGGGATFVIELPASHQATAPPAPADREVS